MPEYLLDDDDDDEVIKQVLDLRPHEMKVRLQRIFDDEESIFFNLERWRTSAILVCVFNKRRVGDVFVFVTQSTCWSCRQRFNC